METNLLSNMYLTQLLLPALTTSSSPYKSLIYTASLAAHNTYNGGAAYCASKHGLLGFAHCIFEEVRETGLKVSSICPGFVNTEMIDDRLVHRSKQFNQKTLPELLMTL